MKSIRTSAPAVEPLTVAEAAANSRVIAIGSPAAYATEDSDKLTRSIAAARQLAEERTSRALITQTWKTYQDYFPLYTYEQSQARGRFPYPLSPAILLPWPRLISVVAVKYYDENGVQQTMSTANYQVDIVSEPGCVLPAPGLFWPATQLGKVNAIEIEHTCGYGATAGAVPESIREWIAMCVDFLFNNRSLTATEPGLTVEIPLEFGAEMLAPHVVNCFGRV